MMCVKGMCSMEDGRYCAQTGVFMFRCTVQHASILDTICVCPLLHANISAVHPIYDKKYVLDTSAHVHESLELFTYIVADIWLQRLLGKQRHNQL